jgi:hypothetical protein
MVAVRGGILMLVESLNGHSMNFVFSNRTLVKRPRRHLVLLVTAMVLVSTAAPAPGKMDLTELDFRHGIAFFHDLKYPADFEHLDYVNPDAPKGGKLVLPTQASFFRRPDWDLITSIDVIWPGPERQTSRVESIAVDQRIELVHPP